MAKMPISFKKAAGKTSIKHNNRDFNEKDWENDFHKHIDRERENENIYLEQTPIREKYQELFGMEVEKYNSTQKRKDRKIDDYYDKVKNDKTLNTQYEFIVQVGTKDDFLDKENKEKANDILQDYFKEFEERNPILKIYNAVIHNDEASPHLHLNIILVDDGYKRGMKKRPAFNKAIENQGFERTGDSRQVFREWRNSEVSEIEKLMNKREIKREKVGTNNIHSMPEYKEVQKKIQERKKELSELVKNQPVSVKRENLEVKELSKSVEVKTGETNFFGQEKTKTVKKKTGNVMLPKENLEQLIRITEQYATTNKNLIRFVETDLVKENKDLHKKIKKSYEERNELVDDYNDLVHRFNDKVDEVENLENKVEKLTREIKGIYQGVKKFFKDSKEVTTEQVKMLVGGVVDEVKELVQGGEFEKEHRKANPVRETEDCGPSL